jgi:hypothetical protein
MTTQQAGSAGPGDQNRGGEGTLVHLPGGSVHWFRFGPGGGEMISMTSRPGAAAFFADVEREVSPAEPDFGVLLGVASSHGLTVPLPAS